MGLQIRALFGAAALVAASGVMTVVHADELQTPTADAATTTAIAKWRADALTRVTPSLQGAVAALYLDQPVDSSTANTASMARTQAEQAAWVNLDASSASQISTYYAAVSASIIADVPLSNETNDN